MTLNKKNSNKLILTALLSSSLLACSGDSKNSSNPPEDKPTPVIERSVARQWNEVTLTAIRNDFARPTIHARNLHHISAAMYDAWSSLASTEKSYLFGKTLHGFTCPSPAASVDSDQDRFRQQAISYAAYRLIRHRFADSPDAAETFVLADQLMDELGYDKNITETDYTSGSAAALGNYIAQCYINYGLQDGSNEVNNYANTRYQPYNPIIEPDLPGAPGILDLNRWQAISLDEFIDQGGNPISTAPVFLSPEWGQVLPFALEDADKTTYSRDDFDYQVYFDPGLPPQHSGFLDEEYKWSFSMVAIWSSHLDQNDGVIWDISPNAIGNIDLNELPREFSDYRSFYKTLAGGDASTGYDVNPKTGQAYAPQRVPRADYARVLAEFWADGPDSETPPGHWFVILNEVSDHPELEKKWQGTGETLSALEWDIKAYFAMGGAMHDSAIAAWGIKGWYDYVRPVSAIRAMSDLGQSSDPTDLSYHDGGIPLTPGYVELVRANDPLAGINNENIGKIKVFAWKGPDYISNPDTDQAGVDWILAENWWPYQRPTFVSPPFAGYVSGHSTYSRAAAELMTLITGDEYFPGGMSGFEIKKNDFLVFEEGPSVDMTLQWATYRDASDQCSLSRIWGGIHPPADDIPGRFIGEKIGPAAFSKANSYISGAP